MTTGARVQTGSHHPAQSGTATAAALGGQHLQLTSGSVPTAAAGTISNHHQQRTAAATAGGAMNGLAGAAALEALASAYSAGVQQFTTGFTPFPRAIYTSMKDHFSLTASCI